MSKIKEYPRFVSEVASLSVEDLKARIVQLQQALEESEEQKESDNDLRDAKHVVLELSEPYKEVKKAVKVKTKHIIDLLKKR
jgi:hypothetical protein